MTSNPRYESQQIACAGEYRITDTRTDSRVATCWHPDNARFVCDALNAYSAGETTAPPLEKPLAYNVLDEIRERHARISHLLSITPGAILGPMDGDAAHTDRNYLLGLIPPEWTYRGAVKTSGDAP